jgi:serine/threonine protein kinase
MLPQTRYKYLLNLPMTTTIPIQQPARTIQFIFSTKMGPRRDFEVVTALGTNGGGCNLGVFIVRNKYSGKIYIEKRVDKQSITRGYAGRELRAMLQCRSHPNIVQIRAHDFDYSRVRYGSFFMQHCELGSLDDVIERFASRNARLPDEGFLWKVFFDASLAFCHLWTGRSATTTRQRADEFVSVNAHADWNPIVHRDVKPGNFFITSRERDDNSRYPTIVLGDFGLCTTAEDVRTGRASLHTNSGYTPEFTVPEHPQYSKRSDIYQLALTIHCLAHMSMTPDMGHRNSDSHPLPRWCRDRGLRDLVSKCLHPDPTERPSPNDLPAMVLKAYRAWRLSRWDDGARLPSWAFG